MPKAKRDISGLLKYAQEKNTKTLLRVRATLQEMIKGKQIITFSRVAKQAQVSRPWLYKNDEIKNKIETIRKEQSKITSINFVEKNNSDPKMLIQKLRQRVKSLQQENSELRDQIEVIYGKMLEKEPN